MRFWYFFDFLEEFLEKWWKTRKNGFCVRIWILSSKFSCQMLTADKRHVFSFHENWKNQFRGFKTKKCIQFISFPRLLRPVNDCSVKWLNKNLPFIRSVTLYQTCLLFGVAFIRSSEVCVFLRFGQPSTSDFCDYQKILFSW